MNVSKNAASFFLDLPHEGGKHRIHVRHWGRHCIAGETPLFCVHGLTRHGGDFATAAEKLRSDRDVYAPDMPGRGRSEYFADPKLYNYGQYCADNLGLLAQLGLARVDWLGTSMGGLIGTMLASGKNSPIRKLVLNDIGPFLPKAAMQRIGEYVGKKIRFTSLADAETWCRKIYSGFGIRHAQDWRAFTEESVKPLPGGGFTLHYDLAIAAPFMEVTADIDLWKFYDAIEAPVLLIRGEISDTLLAETAEEMTRRGPRARLVTIPGVGHAPALLEGGQIETIRAFLEA